MASRPAAEIEAGADTPSAAASAGAAAIDTSAPARAGKTVVAAGVWPGMNVARASHRFLRSPTLWIALAMVLASAAATLAVGVHLYHHTAVPMVYDRR